MREPAREKEKTGPEIGGSRGLGWFLGVWKGMLFQTWGLLGVQIHHTAKSQVFQGIFGKCRNLRGCP